MKIYVWDKIVRLTHILLILGIITAFVTYESDMMEWHMLNGYALLGVVTLRIIWGFIGTPNARFASFIKHPRVVFNYITSWKNQRVPTGHNPLGGYAVLALLGALLLQGVTGLFATDDVLAEGPLYSSVSSSTAKFITFIHENNFWFLLLPLIGIHITAVIVYWRVKKVNLVRPMITGYKET